MSWARVLTLSAASDGSTSKVTALPVSLLTAKCMPEVAPSKVPAGFVAADCCWRGDSSHVLDQGLGIVCGVRRLDVQGDSLACEPPDGQLHAKCCDAQGGGRLRGSRSLLVMRDSSHVQGQGHDIVSGVRWLNAQGDSLASEPHDGQLHAKCCDVHCAARFRGSRPLLARRGSPHVLGRSLDLVRGVRWLDVQGDGLACEPLDGQLHARSCAAQGVGGCRGSQPLLVRRDSSHVLGPRSWHCRRCQTARRPK